VPWAGFALTIQKWPQALRTPCRAASCCGRQCVGGGGIAPLAGGDPDVCELRKMYFLREVRGHGQGRRMLQRCIDTARQFGYRRCYLETLTGMDAAQHLYLDAGFKALCGPLGATGHFACDRYFALDL
jgi:putative acetyltransferase